MKVKMELECSPEEARAFLGLPDVGALNEHLTEELGRRLEANLGLARPEELIKGWMELGGRASAEFLKAVTAASPPGRPKGA